MNHLAFLPTYICKRQPVLQLADRWGCDQKGGYASQRALRRLACYQADARAFNMPRFLRNIRATLGCPPFLPGPVPGNLVRDIGLPALSHHPAMKPNGQRKKEGLRRSDG